MNDKQGNLGDDWHIPPRQAPFGYFTGGIFFDADKDTKNLNRFLNGKQQIDTIATPEIVEQMCNEVETFANGGRFW